MRERRSSLPAGKRQRSTSGDHRKRMPQGTHSSAVSPINCSEAPSLRSSVGRACVIRAVMRVWVM